MAAASKKQNSIVRHRRCWLGAVLLAGLLFFAVPHLLDRCFPPDLQRYQHRSLLITDRNGEWLRAYLSPDQTWRLPLQADQLPDDYLKLLINFEDRRFYQHNGIDYPAIIRAIGQNLRHGRIVSGASTLSMQTARLLMPHSRSWTGKLGELFRAWQLERRFSKTQILQMYMQLAPMGGNLEGITSAAYHYFNKPADKLSLAEAAWLVALPQSPTAYHPLRYPQRAKQARDQVLNRAFSAGLITPQQYQSAVAQAVSIRPTAFPLIAPHFSDQVKSDQVKSDQVKSDQVKSDQVKSDQVKNAQVKNNQIKAEQADKPPCVIQTSLHKPLQIALEKLLNDSLKQRHANSNLAAAIMDNQSGEYLAYVGSADFFAQARSGQIDMLQAVRSPGSALKPFVTLFAFDWLNYQPTTLIQDTPILDDLYRPNNYDGYYQGEMTLANALVRSRNVPAVRLLRAINPFRFSHHLQQQGLQLYFPANAQPNLSVALGGVGIKGAQLLKLYRTLANCGYDPNTRSALASSLSCWQITEILQQSQDQNGRLFWGKAPVAFKTGTAYGWRDQWLFAYTEQYSLVLWGGRADGKFANQRASAEDLIPLLRKVLGLLPNPPHRYLAPSYPLAIRSGRLPAHLQRVNSAAQQNQAQRAVSAATLPLAIVTPLHNSVLELPQARDLTLQISGGSAPYLWFLNDNLIEQGYPNRTLLSLNGNGSYRLVIVDANGNSVQSDFRVRILSQSAPRQPNRAKIIRADARPPHAPADSNFEKE
ncbi:penicillin-binding protein 1C [Pasteurella testudinis DSM 23072]|uniref:peptidoglycan glycosyltransferase n=1 Tax=Pasteurella testudinis DSM 23072 TaxID=1122938 RepID=A0A1W1UBZ1_9PAST|nr:transglycosylase domain-containing protein [Pasteurella testudinis]SMB78587.1 penicillin-binding protein 1C [Pasteurella testudinis DSM 23072]SUB52555.1 penicillin-binding protein 1C [Pasteurella testudinis]